ncbi:M16 family metallopeptidase [Aureibacter tunicatorum]|uniref:Zn-dependent peptidase n=1 Tax=Aureibacter tunicatorum TaxID=866807 RepID=A0AAE3XL57_9BACT|nr:pitrilysin family protein [Aureibacter tunicatorum]MDR6238004.1 putative Zn-dependent peptidase [Aureibacter tunicatorum]
MAMTHFEKKTLKNGLQVIIHQDTSTPLVAFNLIYHVGSKDENPHKTGMAHLFEHLMFTGSQNIEKYDEQIQRVGGENNAFTSPDITNYYITLPSANVETAFWLESDRMKSLSFNNEGFITQQRVVIEEFKQRYLNQPYGDLWLHMRPLCYQNHSYQWPTIGKNIEQIENITLKDLQEFSSKYYTPNNAVLSLAGDIDPEKGFELAEKWFGSIPSGEKIERNIPVEKPQTAPRTLTLHRDVPHDVVFKAFHMPGKNDPEYQAIDLLSDILGRGRSSRLFQQLVAEKKIFSSINSYVTGSFDPGLLVISGKLHSGKSPEEAVEVIDQIIEKLKTETIDDYELQKVKNQAEASLVFSEMEILNIAMFLGYATILGDTNLVNEEIEQIRKVTPEDIKKISNKILREENSSTMLYLSDKQG